MGSFDVARTYFQTALAGNPPPEIKNRINLYLAEINQQAAPERITGIFFSGIQYQSDANVAPGASLINSPLGSVLLNNQFVKAADGNIFGSGEVLYTYDLGNQRGNTGDMLISRYSAHAAAPPVGVCALADPRRTLVVRRSLCGLGGNDHHGWPAHRSCPPNEQ
jgi:hypothetical protein